MGISHVISWTNGVDLNQNQTKIENGKEQFKASDPTSPNKKNRFRHNFRFTLFLFFLMGFGCMYECFLESVFCCNLVIPIFVFLCKSCLPHVCFDPSIGWNESADFGKTCCLDYFSTKEFLIIIHITICINCYSLVKVGANFFN